MSKGVFQPVGQKRLTNISVVRLKKHGIRFEIACYPNKVRDWRNGIEKDLDEVLQSTTVFSNVSKGVLASEEDLKKAFGTTEQKTICLEILQKGDLQVADKERKQEFDHLFKDIAGILVEKCVNPETNRPYTMSMLERALRDCHINIDPKKNAKTQALEVLPLLQQKFPIQRARMRLKLTVPSASFADLQAQLAAWDQQRSAGTLTEHVELGDEQTVLIAQVDPGIFRDLHNFMQTVTGARGRMDVLSMAIMAEGVNADEFAHMPQVLRQSAASPVNALSPASPSINQSSNMPVSQEAASAPAHQRTGRLARPDAGSSGADFVYRGSIEGIPEAHSSRKERFSELDTLQPGWEVELRSKGDTVEAVFYSPSGHMVGSYVHARKLALQARKAEKLAAEDLAL